MDNHLLSYYIGITIIFLMNLAIVFSIVPSKSSIYYAFINISGAFCIAYYFMHKEGFISF